MTFRVDSLTHCYETCDVSPGCISGRQSRSPVPSKIPTRSGPSTQSLDTLSDRCQEQ